MKIFIFFHTCCPILPGLHLLNACLSDGVFINRKKTALGNSVLNLWRVTEEKKSYYSILFPYY